MAVNATLLSGLVILAQSIAPGATVVLSCNLPAAVVGGTAPGAPVGRIFKVGRASFQEWDAGRRQFGRNLCRAYACTKAEGRREGTVSSASVAYTVGVSDTGEAYWRALGATGFAAKQGSCRVISEPKP